jgi:hypothetical protein
MLSDDMRKYAQDCREQAASAGKTPAAQGVFLRAAEAWEKVADKTHQAEARRREYKSTPRATRPPYPPAGRPKPAAARSRASDLPL